MTVDVGTGLLNALLYMGPMAVIVLPWSSSGRMSVSMPPSVMVLIAM